MTKFICFTANILPTAPSSEIPSMKIHEIISDKLPHPTILKTSTCSSSKIYPNVTLLGGIKSGNFTSLGKTKNMQECIGRSCDLGQGDMAFMLGSYCYLVSCYSDRVCQTIPAQPSKFHPRIAFLKWAPKITEEGESPILPLCETQTLENIGPFHASHIITKVISCSHKNRGNLILLMTALFFLDKMSDVM